MKKKSTINTLLICDDVPSSSYGTGQRLLAIKLSLDTLGECRILHLSDGIKPAELSHEDYMAPRPLSLTSSKLNYVKNHLSLKKFRFDNKYERYIHDIKQSFQYDVVVCSFLRNSPAVPNTDTPCILDLDAIEEPNSLFTKLLWPYTKWRMRLRASDFTKIFIIRPRDKSLFGLNLVNKVVYLPGFSASAKAVEPTIYVKNQSVLIVGSMHWPPNKEAVESIIVMGLPAILASRGWYLRLVGSGTDAYEKVPGISSAGFVNNIQDEYDQAGIVACAISSGSGANIKLAEAIQMGCAVVATKHSAMAYEGFLQPGHHLLVGDNQKDFFDKMLYAIDNQNARKDLEKNAHDFSVKHLNQSVFSQIVVKAVEQAAK